MEAIEMTKNCVTTECGHCFHTNCLMQNVAHNGFGCPYCRTKMADEPDEEITDYSEEEEDESEMFDDDALRGFRFFFNNINEEAHDQQDIAEEEEVDVWESEDEEDDEDENIPSTDFVAQKLRQQGVTFEQLVKVLCLEHNEYDDDESAENLSNELFGKIRIIISNYSPQQALQTPSQNASQQVAISAPPSNQDTDFAAQPKNVTVRRRIQEE
jgi:hypothetical protein